MATGSTHHRWAPPEVESEASIPVKGVDRGGVCVGITENTGVDGGSERDGQKSGRGL